MVAKILARSPEIKTDAEAVGALVPRLVNSRQAADNAASSEDRRIVWILRDSKFAARIIRSVEWPGKRAGFVIIAGKPNPNVIPALSRRFERVAFSGDAEALLPNEQLVEVLTLPDRTDRFIGGIVDKDSDTVTLWRGDLTSLIVPFSTFVPTANGIRPNFSKFAVDDYGHTIRFGNYEAAADALLYEFDPDFRRRLKQQRRATEQSLGASIRRLRMQRQLTRNDFPGIDPKTLARIEGNPSIKPHAATLRISPSGSASRSVTWGVINSDYSPRISRMSRMCTRKKQIELPQLIVTAHATETDISS